MRDIYSGAIVTETLATPHLGVGLHYRAGICGSFGHCSFTPPLYTYVANIEIDNIVTIQIATGF